MRHILKTALFFIFMKSFVYAGIFTISEDPNINFPSQMLVGQPGLSQYEVTNTSNVTTSINFNDLLPAGFTVEGSAEQGYCEAGMLLNSKANCTLLLYYTSSTPASSLSYYVPYVCPEPLTDVGCIAPGTPASFSEVSTLSNPPILSSSSNNIILIPGQVTVVDVNNTGAQNVNNARLILPSDILAHVDATNSVLVCRYIPAQGRCEYKIFVDSDLEHQPDFNVTIQGSNTNPLTLSASTAQNSFLQVSNVTLIAPNAPYQATLTNTGASAISDLSISGELPAGVTQESSTCSSTLAGQASCSIEYFASADAMGTTTITINYSSLGIAKVSTFDLIVPKVSVVINPNDSGAGSDILADNSGSFLIKNTGAYAWQKPSVSFDQSNTWLTLDSSNCLSAGSLEPSGTCTVRYTISTSELHDLSATITATGQNAQATSQMLEPQNNLSIGLDSDAAQQHLMAAAVKVTNLTKSDYTLSSVQAGPPNASIILCSTLGGTANCTDTPSTCSDGAILTAGKSCDFWYQANNANQPALLPDTSYSQTISLTATSGSQPSQTLSLPIYFHYGNDLYVSSLNLSPVTGSPTYNLEKWDGTSWSTPSYNPLDGAVKTMIIYKNDLYVAGDFSKIGSDSFSKIAKWNGNNWSNLGAGLNASALALSTDNKSLYVGGNFTQAGGILSNHLAQWDGTTWFSVGAGLNDNVLALASYNNKLYVGGNFTQAGGKSGFNHIAEWDGTTSSWSELGDGLGLSNVSVAAITADNASNVYVGGQFTTAGGAPAKNIAQWNGSTWSYLGTADGLDGSVSSLNIYTDTSSIDHVYVGGNFKGVGLPSTSSIAQWNNINSEWSSVGKGLPYPVSSLMNAGGNLYAGMQVSIAIFNGSDWSTLNGGDSKIISIYKLFACPHLALALTTQSQHS